MADLDPLKFSVAIKDDVTKQLERIEKELSKLKDKNINVKVDDSFVKNVERMKDALYRIQEARAKVGNAIKEASGFGINVSGMKIYMQVLDAYEKKLQKINGDTAMMQSNGWQTQAFGTTFKHLLSNADDFQKAVGRFKSTLEPAKKTAENLGSLIDKLNAQKVDFRGMDMSNLDAVIQRIRYIQRTLQEFGSKGSSNYGYSANEIVRNMALADATKAASNELKSLRKNLADTASEERRLHKELQSSYDSSKTKIAEVSIKIEKYREALSNASGTPISTTELDIQKAKVVELLDLLKQIRGNGGKTDSGQSLKEVMREYGQYIKYADYAMSKLNKQVVTHRKNSAKDPELEAAKEYASLLRQITSMKRAETKANSVGVDTAKLRQSIELLERYRASLQMINDAHGNYNGQTVFSFRTSDYLNERATGANLRNRADAAYQVEKANQSAAKSASILTAEEQRLLQSMNEVSHAGRNQSQVLSDLKSMAMQYLSVWGAQQFVNNIIETGGLLEQQRLSIGAILGDMEQATTLFDKIKSLALKSPFGVVELDKMSKQLTAYGFEYKELYEWTKRLADISAATGTEVSRLSLALGHVRSEGALSGYTLRQFAMANVPVLKMLSENLGISAKEVRDRVRKKEVSYKDVKDILKQLTDDGGMFYNAQEVMSGALNAKFKNLRDAFDIMYGEIAESGVGNSLKSLAETLTAGAKQWERFGKDILFVASAFGLMRAATLIANSAIGSNTGAVLANVRATTQSELAKKRLSVAMGEMTLAEYRALASSGKYSVTLLKVALQEEKLTFEDLKRAVALGKVNAAVARAAAIQAGYDAAMVKSLVTMSVWRRGLFYVAAGFTKAGIAIKGMIASLWPMLALSVVFDLFSRASQQSEAAMESGKEAAKAATKEYDELRKANEKLGESEGKSEEELRKGIKAMESALEKSGQLTPALREQASKVNTLTEKYDLLRQALRGAAEDFDDLQARMGSAWGQALDARGGAAWYKPWKYIEHSMEYDLKQYSEYEIEFRSQLTSAGKTVRTAIENELRRLGKWDDKYKGMGAEKLLNLLNPFEQHRFLSRKIMGDPKELRELRAAYQNVIGAEFEISTGKQREEFVEYARRAIAQSPLLADADWDNLTPEQKINADKIARRLIHGIADISDTAREKVHRILVEDLLGGAVPEYTKEVLDEVNNDLDDEIDPKGDSKDDDKEAKKLREKVRILKEAGDAFQYWRDKVGDESAEEHVRDEFGKLLAELGFSFEDVEKFRESLEKLREEYEKKPKTKGMLEALKELDKELADLNRKDFEKGAAEYMSKVKQEMKDLKQSWDIYKSVSEETGDEEMAMQIAGIKNKPNALTGADYLKEHIIHEMDKIFGQGSGLFLDFNSHLSDYEIKDMVQSAFRDLEPQLPENADEPARKKYIYDLSEYQKKIGGVVDMMKDWRDLQQEVLKEGGDLVKKLMGDLVDEQTRLAKIAVKYKYDLAKLDALRDSGQISDNKYNKAVDILYAESSMATVKAKKTFDALMNGVKTLSRDAAQKIKREFIDALTLQLRTGKISAQEYAKSIGEINEKLQELEKNPSYVQSYLEGGLDGLFENMKRKGAIKIEEGGLMQQQGTEIMNENFGKNFDNFMEGKNMVEMGQGMSEMGMGMSEMGGDMQQTIKIIDMIIHAINNLVQGMKEAYDQIKEMYTALGKDTTTDEWTDTDTFFNSFSNASSSATKGWDSLKNGDIGGVISGVVGSVTSWITGIVKGHDAKKQHEIDLAQRQLNIIKNMDENLDRIKERSLGYATRSIDQRTNKELDEAYNKMRTAYTTTKQERVGAAIGEGLAESIIWSAVTGMLGPLNIIAAIWGGIHGNKKGQEYGAYQTHYYSDETLAAIANAMESQSVYSAEYASLLIQQEELQKQLHAEENKVDSDEDKIEEYTAQLAELEDKIKYFAEDLAKELWGIDFQGWADQISDALMTAFENGEDAARAFDDAVKGIMQNVANEAMKIAVIEPMMEELRTRLFGKVGADGQRHGGAIDTSEMLKNPSAAGKKIASVTTSFFAEAKGTIVSAYKAMYEGWDEIMRQYGWTLDNTSQKTLSAGIQGTAEETSELLAGYVNALRQDVAVNRLLFEQYVTQMWPEYYAAFEQSARAIVHVDTNVQAMMEMMRDGSGAMFNEIHQLRSRIDNVVDGMEGFTVR